jgi:hypothetical protein
MADMASSLRHKKVLIAKFIDRFLRHPDHFIHKLLQKHQINPFQANRPRHLNHEQPENNNDYQPAASLIQVYILAQKERISSPAGVMQQMD